VGPTLKEGDKVYLLRKNIATKRPSDKLDHKKLGPFEIVEIKSLVNYRLKLPIRKQVSYSVMITIRHSSQGKHKVGIIGIILTKERKGASAPWTALKELSLARLTC
jgi:hypothetical protein